jgi:hypothetical protein
MLGAVLPLIAVLASVIVGMLAFVYILSRMGRHRSEQ